MYRRFGLENPRDYRVIFMGAREDLPAPKQAQKAVQTSTTFRFLADRVTECMKARVLAKGDAVEIAAVIWAHVHGLVSLRLSGQMDAAGDDAAFAKFFRDSTDRLFKGLAP